MDKKKLLIVTNTLVTFGGGEKWALEVAVRLKRRYEITIANPKATKSFERIGMKELSKDYSLSGINIVDLDSFGIGSSSFQTDRYLFVLPKVNGITELTGLIKSADVIYLMSFNPALFSSVIMLSNIYGKRLIVGVHNPTFSKIFDKNAGIRQRALNRAFLEIAKKVKYFHVLNDRDQALVSANFPTAQSYKVPVFIYKRQPRFKAKGKKFIALFVGRLETSQKGIDMLSKVMTKTLLANKDIFYHIIGGKGDGEGILRSVERKYPKNVTMMGYVPDRVHVSEFMNASMCVCTSRYETFPAFILEAQSYGLHTVAFDIEGVNTIMNPDGGDLIAAFDQEAFADAVLKYYKKWKGMGKDFKVEREKISGETYKRYSVETVMPMLEKMIDEVSG